MYRKSNALVVVRVQRYTSVPERERENVCACVCVCAYVCVCVCMCVCLKERECVPHAQCMGGMTTGVVGEALLVPHDIAAVVELNCKKTKNNFRFSRGIGKFHMYQGSEAAIMYEREAE